MIETTPALIAEHIRARLAKSTLDSPAINVSRPGWSLILAALAMHAEETRDEQGARGRPSMAWRDRIFIPPAISFAGSIAATINLLYVNSLLLSFILSCSTCFSIGLSIAWCWPRPARPLKTGEAGSEAVG